MLACWVGHSCLSVCTVSAEWIVAGAHWHRGCGVTATRMVATMGATVLRAGTVLTGGAAEIQRLHGVIPPLLLVNIREAHVCAGIEIERLTVEVALACRADPDGADDCEDDCTYDAYHREYTVREGLVLQEGLGYPCRRSSSCRR